MRLTTRSEYALLALIYIARYGQDDFVKIEEICAKYKISKKYLEQLFVTMKQNHLLKAKTGAKGGYRLAMPSEKISIARIVRLMDGALAPVNSVSRHFFSHTPIEQEKKIVETLREIRNYVSNKLENVKLSDLI